MKVDTKINAADEQEKLAKFVNDLAEEDRQLLLDFCAEYEEGNVERNTNEKTG